MSPKRTSTSSSPAERHVDGRPWSEAESDAAFAVLGDRVIDATRRFLRYILIQRIKSEIYTVGSQELTLAQVDALEAVTREGELRMNELAAHLGVDPSTVTRTTAPLVDLGLLERFTDPANRRYVVLRGTEQGRATARLLAERRRSTMRRVLAGMEPERRLLFAELLEEYTSLTEQTDVGTGDGPGADGAGDTGAG